MYLSKAGQPDYKPADRFINWWPAYKPVRFTIGSQHIYTVYTYIMVNFHWEATCSVHEPWVI